ncbi:MAG: 1-acyl-sn-glycerol-3-phosphate acyltransferase [Clostridia bacterium]|nr:1-acyl-sn-glycerol-3-phosphate acyltransferase [Clostridia bacterium]
MAKNKVKKWAKFRHKVVRKTFVFPVGLYMRLKYRVKIRKFGKDKSPHLILLNHQTPFDQIFCGFAFKQPIYYMATEDLFSNGLVSKVIKYLLEPIPIKKQTTDVRAVLNCLKVAKEGGTIAIAPEGNRTYSGKTEYINPAIIPLIKKINLPVAIFKIEGGYGAEPRWSDVCRRGTINCGVTKVIPPSDFKDLSNEELYNLVCKELFVDESVSGGLYYHKKSAEYLERVIYVCPDCGFSHFYSSGKTFECKKCGKKVIYLADKTFKGVNCDAPFKTVNDWYEYQKSFVCKVDPASYIDSPIYVDTASVKEVIPYKKKVSVYKTAKISLYGNRIVIESNGESMTFDFDRVSALAVLGRNKANIYINGKAYQLKGDKRFNSVKYVNFYYHYVNVKKGEENEQFLGL